MWRGFRPRHLLPHGRAISRSPPSRQRAVLTSKANFPVESWLSYDGRRAAIEKRSDGFGPLSQGLARLRWTHPVNAQNEHELNSSRQARKRDATRTPHVKPEQSRDGPDVVVDKIFAHLCLLDDSARLSARPPSSIRTSVPAIRSTTCCATIAPGGRCPSAPDRLARLGDLPRTQDLPVEKILTVLAANVSENM
jgi:hypothetical protein